MFGATGRLRGWGGGEGLMKIMIAFTSFVVAKYIIKNASNLKEINRNEKW